MESNGTIESKVDATDSLTWEQLQEWCFAPGDLYWKSPSGRNVKVVRGGELLDHARCEKFFKKRESLEIDFYVDEGLVDYWHDAFLRLQSARLAPDQIKVCQEFTAWMGDIFWHNRSDFRALELVEACHRSFYDFDEKTHLKLTSASEELTFFIALQGSFSVSLALLLGFANFDLLKDLYRSQFLYHLSLIDQFNYRSKENFWGRDYRDVLGRMFNGSKNEIQNYKGLLKYPIVINLLDTLSLAHSSDESQWSKADFSDLESLTILSFIWAHEIYSKDSPQSVLFPLKGKLAELFNEIDPKNTRDLSLRMKMLLSERLEDKEDRKEGKEEEKLQKASGF